MNVESQNWSPIAKVYDPLKAGSIDGTDTAAHDQGVIRAINAKYRPNRAVAGDPECTLFVGRLHPKTTEKMLHEVFSSFGEIKRVRLVRDIVTGFSKCYAFVEYVEERDAHRAQKQGNKMELDTKEIFVDFECERTLKGWVPRRLGGGLGGKKESGQLRFGGLDRPFRKPILLGGSAERFQNRQSNSDRQWGGNYKFKDRDRQVRGQGGEDRGQAGRGRNRDGGDRDQVGRGRNRDGGDRDQVDRDRDQAGRGRDRDDGDRDQVGRDRDQLAGRLRDRDGRDHRDQHGRNRDQRDSRNREQGSRPYQSRPNRSRSKDRQRSRSRSRENDYSQDTKSGRYMDSSMDDCDVENHQKSWNIDNPVGDLETE